MGNEKTNSQLELEQLSLWNRHGETTLWTVGSILLTSSFYAFSKLTINRSQDTIQDPNTVVFISISFIVVLSIFIFYYVPIVIKDTIRMTTRMKKLDDILNIKLTQSLSENNDSNKKDESERPKCKKIILIIKTIIQVYKTPFGLLFLIMSISNIVGWICLL